MTEPRIPTIADYQNWMFDQTIINIGEEKVTVLEITASVEHPGFVCHQIQLTNGIIITICREVL